MELDRLRQRVVELEAQLTSLQVAPAHSNETDTQFVEKLKTLNDISIQLSRAESFDEVCYQGIKLGVERLGFDRLSLWFVENSRRFMVGTFGVDEHGIIRDERQQQFRSGSDAVKEFSVGRRQAVVSLNAPLLNDRSEEIGEGWHIAVPLLDGDQFVGFMSADNLINKRPLLDYQPELLQLYGSTIGYLGKSKQEHETVQKLRRAIEHSSSMVILCDVAGNIEYVNPAFSAISGYSFEDMLNNTLAFLVDKAGLADEYWGMWAALTAGAEWRGEWHNQKSTGEFYDTLVSISPVKNIDGHIVHFVMVQEDITEHKRREAQEIILKLEREQVNLLREFIADIAHEFKTPLAIINTKSYLIKRELGEVAPLEHITLIEAQVEQINVMLNEMLLMMRLGQAADLNIQTVDLVTVIGEAAAKVRRDADEKQISWANLFGQKSLPLRADAERLRIALYEVFDNAVTFTEVGGKISVDVKQTNELVHVRVNDNGVGIDREEIDKVFTPFYRVNKARTIRGTGLGLSIVRRIIELHGGKVTLTSTLGQGTTVDLYLPVGNDQ